MGADHRSPPASVTHPRPFGTERGKRPGCGRERRWKRKEEAFGKCTRAWLWTRALSWAGPRGWHRTGHPPGMAWRAERAGRARSRVLPRGRARPGCARGREAQGQSSPALALAPPPGGEAKVRQESLLRPTLRTDGVGGEGGLTPKWIPSSKDRSPPPKSRPATSLLTSSASPLKTTQEASEAGQLLALATFPRAGRRLRSEWAEFLGRSREETGHPGSARSRAPSGAARACRLAQLPRFGQERGVRPPPLVHTQSPLTSVDFPQDRPHPHPRP